MKTKIGVTRVIPQRVTLGMGRRDEALARTQVYLSKTKLKLQGGYLAVYIVIVQ